MAEKITLPKKWSPEDQTFIGRSGKTYKILDSLTVGRYRLQAELEFQFTFGASSDEILKLCTLITNYVNDKVTKSMLLEQAFNAKKAFKDSMGRMDAYLKYCCLWTTSAGEDISDLPESLIKEKIEDWSEIDVVFFLKVAQTKVAHYIKNYKETSRIISQAEKAGEIESHPD